MKVSSSQQAENKTTEVLQQMEFDVTPYVPVSSTSENDLTIEVTSRVEEYVVSSDIPQNEETIDNVDNDDFTAIRRPKIKKRNLDGLLKTWWQPIHFQLLMMTFPTLSVKYYAAVKVINES